MGGESPHTDSDKGVQSRGEDPETRHIVLKAILVQ
jgi:hypothetical protein